MYTHTESQRQQVHRKVRAQSSPCAARAAVSLFLSHTHTHTYTHKLILNHALVMMFRGPGVAYIGRRKHSGRKLHWVADEDTPRTRTKRNQGRLPHRRAPLACLSALLLTPPHTDTDTACTDRLDRLSGLVDDHIGDLQVAHRFRPSRTQRACIPPTTP
jgi:hypothetical protein